MSSTIELGTLRVWHVPKAPGAAFDMPVSSLDEARKVLDTLSRYDIFLFKNGLGGNFFSTSGLEVYVNDVGDGVPGWIEWTNDDGESITELGR